MITFLLLGSAALFVAWVPAVCVCVYVKREGPIIDNQVPGLCDRRRLARLMAFLSALRARVCTVRYGTVVVPPTVPVVTRVF